MGRILHIKENIIMENEEINHVVGLNADPLIEDKPKRKEPNVCLSCEG